MTTENTVSVPPPHAKPPPQGGEAHNWGAPYLLHTLFDPPVDVEADQVNTSAWWSRVRWRVGSSEILTDTFDATRATCSFLRIPAGVGCVVLAVTGGYRLDACSAGGWLLKPLSGELDSYWIPQPPLPRKLDRDGHILALEGARLEGFEITPSRLTTQWSVPEGYDLDQVVWRFPHHEPEWVESLESLATLERQRYFLWSSHTPYARPADLYLHLVHGQVYENHVVWPRYWRVCSELDAYALFVTLTGLERATSKRLYVLLKRQIVCSVIARQAKDGGWYHGEWTDDMESHFRLHAGAMHLLAASLVETQDDVIRESLERAAAFAANCTDQLDAGAWFLHDSLEQKLDKGARYPFAWAPSRAFGKSPHNLLILNTHLDTTIALENYRRATGDHRYVDLVTSARASAHAVLGAHPADWLYRPLFWAIGLTFLPTATAKTLPWPIRALKRLAWQYLIPRLHHIKARFPRLVMPNGFIDRSLAQAGCSVRYLPVNLMDLARFQRLFDDAGIDLEAALAFTQECGIRLRWKELRGKEDDSLGFWSEALYHLCLRNPDPKYRTWLAEAICDLEDSGLGLSPSLLGGNPEAVPFVEQYPTPSATNSRLRVVNLSHGLRLEVLVVNPTEETLKLDWELPPKSVLAWRTQSDAAVTWDDPGPDIPPRGWLFGLSPDGVATSPCAHDND